MTAVPPGWRTRVWRRLRRARIAQWRRDRDRSLTARLATMGVCALAGLMIVMSAANARGIDLRPGRNTDLVSLVQSQSRRNAEQNAQVTQLRSQVDRLSAQQAGSDGPDLSPELAQRALQAGLSPVVGPGLTVTLDDAPLSVAADGVDEDLLVVHQQDIQAVVNALWRGGAEAMTIQGQRVITTTGVKCVGNTVVLHGIPYAPPYVISAIGDQAGLRSALATAAPVQIYRQYVTAYGLGYGEQGESRLNLPAYSGALDLQYASAPDASPSPSSSPR